MRLIEEFENTTRTAGISEGEMAEIGRCFPKLGDISLSPLPFGSGCGDSKNGSTGQHSRNGRLTRDSYVVEGSLISRKTLRVWVGT
jgi:hypothetical protein